MLSCHQPPEEPLPWTGTLLAHEPGAACMQGLLTGVDIWHIQWSNYSEDCLTMNIYTPQVPRSKRVLVSFKHKN